ncbi:MAG: hypothetical protein MJY83_05600 [Bacteroidales bacterium]|nr:hypothetical protein [Bacteroidales bacterium]
MKKVIIMAIMLMTSISLCAQTPSFRSDGYKWSLSYTNSVMLPFFLDYNGIDTSHGYMLNSRHYFGGGCGFYMVPSSKFDFPTILHAFAEYKTYWHDGDSTPISGLKLGYARGVHPDCYVSAVELEPNVGWNWAAKKGYGLSLCLGAKMHLGKEVVTFANPLWLSIMPTLSIGIEF